jgi:hypothetical protein
VAALAQAEAVVVVGSAALLVRHPELGEPGGRLELTRDADLVVLPCDAELAAMIHEALGEGSLFDQRHGYHADVVRPELLSTLPQGWRARALPLGSQALSLAPVDVAAVKLCVGRAKDLAVVAELLEHGMVERAAVVLSLCEIRQSERDARAALRRLGA